MPIATCWWSAAAPPASPPRCAAGATGARVILCEQDSGSAAGCWPRPDAGSAGAAPTASPRLARHARGHGAAPHNRLRLLRRRHPRRGRAGRRHPPEPRAASRASASGPSARARSCWRPARIERPLRLPRQRPARRDARRQRRRLCPPLGRRAGATRRALHQQRRRPMAAPVPWPTAGVAVAAIIDPRRDSAADAAGVARTASPCMPGACRLRHHRRPGRCVGIRHRDLGSAGRRPRCRPTC